VQGENRVKLLSAAVLVLLLSSLALAAPESKELGPYTIKFDLNSDKNYSIEPREPITSEAGDLYRMVIIKDNSTFAMIDIAEYSEPTDSTLLMHKTLVPMNMVLREGLNVTNVEDKQVDGKDGFVVTAMPFVANGEQPNFDVYRAMYWLDDQKCECGPVSVGKTSVIVSSTYPQDITQNLLDSLHIEKS
jgi:hypothetical protein